MLYISFFFTSTLLVYALIVMKGERKQLVKRRISTFFSDKEDVVYTNPLEEEAEKTPSLYKRFFLFGWRKLKRIFRRNMQNEKEAKLEMKLLQAGNPFGMTPVEYRLLQIAFLLLFPLFSWGYAALLQIGAGVTFLLIAVSIVFALYFPRFYIHQKIKTRNYLALKELPDVLDLLTVSLEAGLGFDSALSKLVSKKQGVLSQEFHRCLEEIRLGKTRREALSGVRERVTQEEIKVLISSILQAEKLGIGMVQVLRIQSAEVRDQRKQRAEEEAMKAPIKMLFPLVLFIFPSLFIVLLGPAIISFIQAFK
ncbi:type II secretion system F family protein [Brevibacillus sp. SYSU BS000544]|uniref:type II secretion system F family protein n=1 Tax=Brevibacillus sp. SYSU BS000544 TaxID=3416443 RepID=UPI003CE539E5